MGYCPLISEDLERLVAHIHRLLEEESVEVTWNKRISDPDNPDQLRQVDVLIRREGFVTHVECRSHKRKQDVTWVEELIGRRQSLGADLIIAVSDAGFTEGAKKKAETHGIVLRELRELSENEVSSWGKKVKLSIKWLHFDDLSFEFYLDSRSQSIPTSDRILQVLSSAGGGLYSIFEAVKKGLDRNGITKERMSYTAPFTVDLTVDNCVICGVEVDMQAWLTEEMLEVPSVFEYRSATEDATDKKISISASEQNTLRVCQSDDEVSVIIDFSKIHPPCNGMLYRFKSEFDRKVRFRQFQLLDKRLPAIELKNLRVTVGVPRDD